MSGNNEPIDDRVGCPMTTHDDTFKVAGRKARSRPVVVTFYIYVRGPCTALNF